MFVASSSVAVVAIVLGLSLDTAKNVAMVAIAAFAALSVVSAVVVKAIVTKLILVAVLVAAAVGVWSQRSNLQDCADRARAGVGTGSVSCTFFGRNVTLDL